MGMLIVVLEKHHFNNITHKYCTDNTYSLFYYVFVEMSLSNFTPAVTSSLEKYKEKYQKLKENYAAKVTENKFEGGVIEVSG